jgi:hypothetical protein
MPRKYKNPRKPYIVSMRITDDEMECIQQLTTQMNKSASDLMRDAFTLFRSQWEIAVSPGSFAEN